VGGAQVKEWLTPTIVAGQTWGVDLASVAKPGGNGYIYSVCDFANAHGYGYVTYNFGPFGTTGPWFLANYLAVVIPDPEWLWRSWNGLGFGESAVVQDPSVKKTHHH
jgi:hypothetical protein